MSGTLFLAESHQAFLPAQLMDLAAGRPIIGGFDQTLAKRVFEDILPSLLVLARLAQAMMKGIALPFPVFMRMRTAEFPLPKCQPTLNGETQVSGRTEKMKMVGHQQVIANEPRIGLPPYVFQGHLDGFLGKPRHAILRANGQEKDGRIVERDFDALGGRFAPGGWFQGNALLHVWRLRYLEIA